MDRELPEYDSIDDENDDEHEDDRSFAYILTTRDGEERIDDRDDAIRMAKEATLDNMQSATVEREDGRVKMQFRQGGLVDYVYETRK
ncbi:MAG: hypothetical protein KC613_22000, partial [Myxococcales bacterium]|nr:hypothetical protein [Myxococcales bacterium]